MKFYKTILIFGCIGLLLNACKQEAEEPDPLPIGVVDKGNIFPNKVRFFYADSANVADSTSSIYFDPNNMGGGVSVVDTIRFKRDKVYQSELHFIENNIDRSAEIRALGTKYFICYRDFNFFKLSVKDLELDNNQQTLGLTAKWRVADTTEIGKIRLTLNYLHLSKTASCEQGSRIVDINFPFKIE